MFFGHAFLKIAARFSGVASELLGSLRAFFGVGSLRAFFDFDETVRGCDCDDCCCDEDPEAPVHAGSELASYIGMEL